MELAEYEIELFHKPGKTMGKADAMSRMAGMETGENDNTDITLLKPDMFISLLQTIDSPESDILEQIRHRQGNIDKAVQKAVEEGERGWERTNTMSYGI